MNKLWTLLCLLLVKQQVDSANILGVFLHPGKSHFDVFKVLMEELAIRGHNVTVVGFFPHPNPPPGYHDVSVADIMEPYVHIMSFEMFETPTSDFIFFMDSLKTLRNMGLTSCNAILPSPQIQDLVARKDFDLAIIEEFNTDCFLGIPYKLQVPYIGFSSCSLMPWHYRRLGNPADPAFLPGLFFKGHELTLTDRVLNVLYHFAANTYYHFFIDSPSQEIAERNLGPLPSLADLAKNTSLMFVNGHFSLFKAKPVVPAFVNIGGLHVKEPKPLPQDLEDFISGAKEGTILFSFGSMLIPESMSPTKIDAFIKTFSRIPQRVIWKIDAEKINISAKDVSNNVKIMKWLPQRDILAHKNVKGFIAHGGLLGMTEAVMSETPMVAVPMFGDQPHNVRAAVRSGFAVKLNYNEITEDSLLEAIREILSEKFQRRAKQLTQVFLDRPLKPLDMAVYWTEYILRNGGDPLRPESIDLPFIQYYQLDVGFIFVVSVIALLWVIKKLISRLNQFRKGTKDKVKKA